MLIVDRLREWRAEGGPDLWTASWDRVIDAASVPLGQTTTMLYQVDDQGRPASHEVLIPDWERRLARRRHRMRKEEAPVVWRWKEISIVHAKAAKALPDHLADFDFSMHRWSPGFTEIERLRRFAFRELY